MEKISIILWFFGVYGLVFFLNDSTIFAPIRKILIRIPLVGHYFFEKLFLCYFCMGVWASLFTWTFLLYAKNLLFDNDLWALCPIYVFGGASAAYILERFNLIPDFIEIYLQSKLQNENSMHNNSDDLPLEFRKTDPFINLSTEDDPFIKNSTSSTDPFIK